MSEHCDVGEIFTHIRVGIVIKMFPNCQFYADAVWADETCSDAQPELDHDRSAATCLASRRSLETRTVS